ncbi:MAG: transglycosylase domain-containing protein [Actinomycetota bacterium]|nr:transglycosylase domain-containing protein [Actinomycetota bacterium]
MRRRIRTFVLRAAATTMLGPVVLAAAVTAPLRWVDPPSTSYRLQDKYVDVQQNVSIDAVSPEFLAALVVHEDPRFSDRRLGVKWKALKERVDAYRREGVDVGGSTTIQTQTVKNLFLWADKTPVRKVILEPVLAEEFNLLLSKRRQLEIYMNQIELSGGIWGICAASWYYYRKAPSELTLAESAGLVGVMPMPKFFHSYLDDSGIFPKATPEGSSNTPVGLLAWSRANVPPQVVRESAVEHLQQRGLILSTDPRRSGSDTCQAMPEGVEDVLKYGPRPRSVDSRD